MEFEQVPGLLQPPLHHEPDHGLPVLGVLLRLLTGLTEDGPRPVLTPREVEAMRRERLARQAAIQEDLHRQRHGIDRAKLQLLQRPGETQEQLRMERERLATCA